MTEYGRRIRDWSSGVCSSDLGKVGTVICGIPVSLLPRPAQRRIIDEMFALMPPGHRFLAYTHRPDSPLPRRELGLQGKRLARTLRNLPPASVDRKSTRLNSSH